MWIVNDCSCYSAVSADLVGGLSLASSNEMFTSGLLIWPKVIQWGNYVKAFVDGHFLLYLRNSVLINFLAVAFVLMISIMAGFACRRMQVEVKRCGIYDIAVGHDDSDSCYIASKL